MPKIWKIMMLGMLMGSLVMYVQAWQFTTMENELVAYAFAEFMKYWTACIGIGICSGLTSYVYSIQKIPYMWKSALQIFLIIGILIGASLILTSEWQAIVRNLGVGLLIFAVFWSIDHYRYKKICDEINKQLK
ncbi:DUF3021 family protein [Paenibacillus alvei]|uniref:DUF3021 family protein n=1 Tax=Paenibacillus alvei TaxID=44250 RepID=A0ABT4H0P0_PAEAL|nr:MULTISPECIES: DUF3021 family protein [Paenibacillus]EJW15031.1 hypothetical protein PAV_10c01490 [Paenibacillus alvei DSM 29]MCY7483431.1 DUF3021 family protein [Paenibacillus alvei]MCY9541072.1 DUF3021 family protein [Paenibacillus alvei]MCY9703765.1 DUF3021 family protein [Paenibacillus alvei]MCY9734539.1 DUF3021 family protein [Paenibacillus alvei]